MLKKYINLDKLLLLIIPFILVIIWFRHGYVLASGESGLPFYNFKTQLSLLNWAWSEGSLGFNIGITSASKPTFMFLAFLEQLGLKGVFLQAALFYFLFVVAGYSSYYLAKKLFPDLQPEYYLLASFFYWFNPISMIGVWNRFLYNYMFFWAELPLLLLLIYQILETRKWLYVLLLNCTFIIFSYVQSSIPFMLLSWLLIIFSYVFYFLFGNGESRKFYIKSLISIIVTFVLINLWWITLLSSFFYSSNYSVATSLFLSTNGNLAGLTGLSKVLGLFTYTFRYFHNTFIEIGPIWARVFSFEPLVLFEYVPSLVILWAIFKYRRIKKVLFLGSLFFLALFLMKGNQPPFGEIFQFFFVTFPSTQVFRNPFEKFGFLLPVAAAPLFIFGISKLVENTQKNFLKKVYFIVPVLVVLLFWGYPFWTGLVFTSTHDIDINKLRSTEVEVPGYYKEANDWLKAQGDNFRFVSLPVGWEGMSYTWKKPYSGVELSTALFDIPNISFNTPLPYYEKITSSLEKNLLSNNNFLELLSLLNVNFLVLREDIDWRARGIRNPQLLQPILDQMLTRNKTFGKLTIYSLPQEAVKPRIYIADHSIKVEHSMVIEDLLMFEDIKGAALYSDKEKVIVPNTTSIVINPNQVNFYRKGDDFDAELALSRMLYARYLPDNPMYPLIRLKEAVMRKVSPNDPQSRFIYDLTHLGKRVAEIYHLVERRSSQSNIDRAINSYIEDVKWVIAEYPERFINDPTNEFKAVIQEEFSKQYIVLEQALAKSSNLNTSKIEKAMTILKKDMVNYGFVTLYPIVLDSPNNNYQVYRFNIREDGKYNIFLDNNQFGSFYQKSIDNVKLQIDKKTLNKSLKFENNLINFGEVFLTEGIHEITMPEPETVNLVQVNKEIVLNSMGQSTVQLPVFPFDPFSAYLVSYDYWIRKGGMFHLVVSSDNDVLESPDKKRNYRKSYSDDKYNHDFIHDEVYVSPRSGSSSLGIGFEADNYNNCRDTNSILAVQCSDKKYKGLFDKETEVVIKNFSVKKVFNNNLHLIQSLPKKKIQVPEIKFSKINPTEYKVQISNAKEPYLLVFSELFSNQWRLKMEEEGFIDDKNHLLVNAYANGWIINRLGSYEMTLKFAPQNLMEVGEKVSVMSALVVLLLTAFVVRKKV